MKRYRGILMPIAKWKKPILKGDILYYSNYNDSLKTRETEEKNQCLAGAWKRGEKNEQVEGTQETFSQLPTGMADAGPSTLVKTHWIYNTKSDVNCGL